MENNVNAGSQWSIDQITSDLFKVTLNSSEGVDKIIITEDEGKKLFVMLRDRYVVPNSDNN